MPSTTATLDTLAQAVTTCTACGLCDTRTQTVFAHGSPNAPVLLVGEGPGQHEDESGVPFVGRAGRLLTEMLTDAGIHRPNDIYICNVVKCRPPKNRAPLPTEIAACLPYLHQQIALVQPKVILLAGATAVKTVLAHHPDVPKTGITKLRGQWFATEWGIPAMPLFHPSYLLRNPSAAEGKPKWLMAQDIAAVCARLRGA